MSLGAEAWALVRRAQLQVQSPVLQLQRSDEGTCSGGPQQCAPVCAVSLSRETLHVAHDTCHLVESEADAPCLTMIVCIPSSDAQAQHRRT